MQDENVVMARSAWLYYVGGFNQEATAKRLGITRARVNKLLQDARETGLVSITINAGDVGLLPVEQALQDHYNLDFCICTPAFLDGSEDAAELARFDPFAFRAVGTAAAAHLRRHLAEVDQAIVATGWGRTLEQMTLQMAGTEAPNARFISLMGSLTANSAYNPFEVVHSLAKSTKGQGFFLPVPFITDTAEARAVLMSQQSVMKAIELGRQASVAYVSLGELRDESLLRRQNMISAEELAELRDLGAVGDTNGIFYDENGRPVDHPLNRRTIALDLEDLRKITTVALVAGPRKLAAARGFLRSGVAKGLIIDGDTALLLAQEIGHTPA